MSHGLTESPVHAELIRIVRQVRQRWRLKLLLRGVALVLAVAFLSVFASAYALDAYRFSPNAVLAFRILLPLLIAVAAGLFLVRPLMRRVSDEQVALYLEEHEPSLEAAIVSAVTATQPHVPTPPIAESPAMVQRLIESAIEKCHAVDAPRRVETRPLKRYSTAVGAVGLGALGLFLLGPDVLRHGASALLLISRSIEAASPYRIDVTPGNATIPRGADQTITAHLDGFSAEDVALLVRKNPTAPFERLPLVAGQKAATYEGMLFDLAAPIEYFVEAAGVRSPVFTIHVKDLPYVQRLELEYHFPAYTGLPPQKVEDGGDIAVLRGTKVHLTAVSTIPAAAGRLLIDDKQKLELSADANGALGTTFTVDKDGFYRIELDAGTGEHVAASPQHSIDVLADMPPTVSISKPGRDTTATPIEEVFVEARGDDDFGVRELELVYSVNGGAEKSLKLFGGGAKALAQVTAGHTFYLEELGLAAGDFVSYYARAADNDSVQGSKKVTSDLYFLQIRPFNKDFKPSVSQSGGGGGGGGQEVGALSQQQRQVIAGTFNVTRDRKTFTAEKLREHTVVLTLAQSRLREQVEGLVQRLNSRLVEPDPAFRKIAELLPQAAAEMKAAEEKLQARKPDEALPPEQRALQHLQKAEEEYETQVSMSRQGGGGGGGGQQGQMAQDLADLFELEMDKLANQYETRERSEQQAADQQMDELAEKLKELARRQQQEAERQRRRALQGQMSQAGGGNSQRELADQAEEAARRLEKLSREQKRPDLMDAARRMREAADAMRRAAASGDPNAAAQASAALERLQDAQKQLDRDRSTRGSRSFQDAVRQADDIAREQREIAQGVEQLGDAGAQRDEKVRQLSERKDTLESKVAELEKHLDRSAGELARDAKDAARKLGEAASSIRDNRLRDKIRYSKGLMRSGQGEYQRTFEEEIGSNIDALRRKLGEASAAMGQAGKADRMTEALEKARDLARGLESLDQRMRDRSAQRGQGQRNQQDQQNQQGQRGGQQDRQDQAQQGQQGQGQQGRQGQSGQQGQGQQGQQAQGQQGQQGQGQQGQAGQQGQGGQQGGQNRGGRADGRDGIGDTTGQWSTAGGYGDRRPGWFTGEEIRQFRGEVRQWSGEAQDLRRRLREQGVDVGDLDDILKSLRAMEDERVYKDVAELERLQTFVTEGLKRFEFGLRRRVETAEDRVLQPGTDEVPAGFRDLVEEYYRSLASRRPATGATGGAAPPK